MAERENETRRQSSMGVRRILGILIAVVCIVGIAAGIVDRGRKIYDNTEEELKANQETYEEHLNQYLISTYVGYKSIVEQRQGKEFSSREIYFNLLDNSKLDEDFVFDTEEETNDYMEERSNQYTDEDYDLEQKIMFGQHLIDTHAVEYVMLDDGSDAYVETINDKKLMTDAKDQKISKELKEGYPITMLLNYGTNGTVEVLDCSGVDQYEIEDALEQMTFKNQFPDETTSEIENVTVLLLVNENAIDAIHRYYGDYETVADYFVYQNFAICAFIGAALVILLAILLMVCHLVGVDDELITRIPVEIAGTAAIFLTLGYMVMSYLTYNLYDGELLKTLQVIADSLAFDTISYKVALLLCVFLWIVYLGLIFIFSVALLQLFRKGFKRFFRENSILVRCAHWISRGISRLYQGIVSFDFDDHVNKVVFKLVAFNALIIAVMCSIWIFGWGVLLVYSMILFCLLRNYLRKVQWDYEKILSATEAMSNGNLNVEINEPVGVFEPLKNELLQVKEGFSHAVDEEVKSQNLRNELITNVSHDLKTPLTAIITYIDLLKDDSVTEEQRKEYVATLDRKAHRLKQLIEDLFEVSKLNSNNIQLQLIKVDLVSLVKQIQFEYEDKFQEKSIELISKLPEEKVMLQLDSQKTYRIFENLYGNIIKYAMPSTRAYVEIVKDEEQVTVTIKNISEHVLDMDGEMLTERFVRGDTSRNTEGSGLGLAIVKSLVEKQGGSIHLIVDGDLFKTVIHFPSSMYVMDEPEQVSDGGNELTSIQ